MNFPNATVVSQPALPLWVNGGAVPSTTRWPHEDAPAAGLNMLTLG